MTAVETFDYDQEYRIKHSFSLIPVWPKSKRPAFGAGEYEPYYKKKCYEEIKPGFNVGVMLGVPSENLVAFDDDTGAETFLSKFPKYRDTTFNTKSGQKGGATLFRLYELPAFNYAAIKKDGKQIEFFARNRQIILPPSIHPDTGRRYEIRNDCKVLNIGREEFQGIFEKFKEDGWEISFSNDKSKNPLGLQNKDAVVHAGENRSRFLLTQIDSWKIKNPEFNEQMLYGLADSWNQIHCDPPYPDDKIRGIVKQAFEFGTRIIAEKNEIEPVDESERLERESKETPVQQIERYLNTQVRDDPKIISQLLRVCLSTYTNDPINIALLAPSSDGKTYATVKVTDIFPHEDVISVGRMSPTALIHDQGMLIDADGEPLQERIDGIDDQIEVAEDAKAKKELQKQKKILLVGARNCIDLQNKILLFLDNPSSATYEMLKPIMSHDKREITYKTTKGDGSLSVKETVIRNWPVFIFCSAKNEDKNEVWEEIKTRVLMTSPESSVTKYKEANRYTALKMGLPSWASGVYHNDEDRKWSKWYVAEFKKNLNELCINGNNPALNLLAPRLADVFPSSQGDYMRHFARLCSFISLETLLNAERRPVYRLGDNRSAVTTIDDIDQACKTLGDISSIPPEKIKFYREVFCPLFDKKASGNTGTLDGAWLTSAELVEGYTKVLGKMTDVKKMVENYLKPLTDAGVLESDQNPNMKQQNIYRKSGTISVQNITELKSKTIDNSTNVESCVRSCLETLGQLSIENEISKEKITINDQPITIEQLITIISGISSKTEEV